MGSQKSRVVGFLAISTFIVVAAVALGLYVGGSPSMARRMRLDEQRSNDLQQIMSAIEQYYNGNQRLMLPKNLDDLRREPNVYISSVVDPKTKQAYTYRLTGAETYVLCAYFETETPTNSAVYKRPMPVYTSVSISPASSANPALHHPGENCFEMKVQTWPSP